MSPDRRGVGCDQDAPEKRTIAKKKKKEKVAWKGFEEKEAAKKEVAKKKRAATGNKTSPSVACVRNLGNSPRVPAGARVGADQHVGKSLPHWRDERRSRPTHRALCRFCPWLLSRRRGVHSGEDSGMRGEARIGTGDAASSCVRLRSLSSRRLLDASRFDCVRLPTCSRSPDSSRSSSMSST